MVVRKIHSSRDLKLLDYYTKFSLDTRIKIDDVRRYMELVEEKYGGLIGQGMLKGTINTQLNTLRPLIKSDLEKHAKKAERTAEFEEEEKRKLRVVADGLLIASGLFFIATNFNPAVALAGLLLSGTIYLQAFLCSGRALAKKDEAQLLREFDVEAG